MLCCTRLPDDPAPRRPGRVRDAARGEELRGRALGGRGRGQPGAARLGLDRLSSPPLPAAGHGHAALFGSHPSYAEIAAILGIPVGTVRSRLNDAKRRLADELRAPGSRTTERDARGSGASRSTAAPSTTTCGGTSSYARSPDNVVVVRARGDEVHGRRAVAS